MLWKSRLFAKKEDNAVYGSRSRARNDRHHSVGAVLISNPIPTQRPRQQNNQQRPDVLRRQFTKINMQLSQALQHLLKADLVTLQDPPSNPNTASPKFNPNAKCAYHSNSPEHDTDQCWALKNKIRDLIDNRTIEFDPPTTLNVITAPMPNHGKGVSQLKTLFLFPPLKFWLLHWPLLKKSCWEMGFSMVV